MKTELLVKVDNQIGMTLARGLVFLITEFNIYLRSCQVRRSSRGRQVRMNFRGRPRQEYCGINQNWAAKTLRGERIGKSLVPVLSSALMKSSRTLDHGKLHHGIRPFT